MLTVGVDLAAETARTAVASIRWSREEALVCDLIVDADDDRIVEAITGADKAGIDCPLGWPQQFVAFVAVHQTGHVLIPDDLDGREWRRRLAFRLTDEAVRDVTGLVPLSVAADRIGHTAMRCAGLLARLARQGQPVDRCGEGVVVEVYPAASLHRWKLPHRGYKGPKNAAGLARVVDELQAAAPWLALDRHEDLCRRSDHAIDAVIAALTAGAASRGLVTRPDHTQAAAAATEGWIALPTSKLDQLMS